MANITDRAAYLRGLAEGMKLDREDNQQRLLLEMLDLMDEMAHQLADANAELAELQEYVEDIDTDLTDMEEVRDLDCLILAVAHSEFRQMGLEEYLKLFREMPNEEKVLVDVKGILDRDAIMQAGIRCWRL